MTKEEKEYREQSLIMARALHDQAKQIADKLDGDHGHALGLLQIAGIDKLTYVLTQILSPDDNRNAVTGEHINKDVPSNKNKN